MISPTHLFFLAYIFVPTLHFLSGPSDCIEDLGCEWCGTSFTESYSPSLSPCCLCFADPTSTPSSFFMDSLSLFILLVFAFAVHGFGPILLSRQMCRLISISQAIHTTSPFSLACFRHSTVWSHGCEFASNMQSSWGCFFLVGLLFYFLSLIPFWSLQKSMVPNTTLALGQVNFFSCLECGTSPLVPSTILSATLPSGSSLVCVKSIVFMPSIFFF